MTRDELEALIWRQLAGPRRVDPEVIDTILAAADAYRASPDPPAKLPPDPRAFEHRAELLEELRKH